MATDSKDTIYIDVDEEITGIVNRVQNSPKKIVALVLPKRAAVFQSIVNMKLLKRTADQNDKKVVLITSEAALMPLAGVAGVHVASNLTSKPFLPPSPKGAAPPPAGSQEDVQIDPKTPIGEVTGEPDESIEVDNSQPTPLTSKDANPKKSKKGGKGLKVPNFDSFRKKLFFAIILGIIIVAGLVWAIFLSPKATVTLKTESSEIPTSFDFSADTNAESLNLESNVVPASKREKTSTETEKSSASGEKDKGSKAGGVVSLKNCSNQAVNIPAGTGISSGNLTYITQTPVSLTDGNFDFGGDCKSTGSHTANVNVVAQNKGEQYNSGSKQYTVSGFSEVEANGSQMSGGSSKVVKIITQQDIDSAKQRIEAKKDDAMKELKEELERDGYVAIKETFSDNSPQYRASPSVGAEGDEVTVTADITYSMLGIKEDDLKKLIDEQVKDQVNSGSQGVLDQGLSSALYQISGDAKGDVVSINIQTNVSVGPDLNQDELKAQIAGKKPSEAEAILTSRSGVIEAKVEVKPGWASSIPKKTARITFVIEDAQGKEINTGDQTP
mgnify:CR=1 FL=1